MKRVRPPSLDELLFTPGRLSEAIDAERRAKEPPQGWLGMFVLARQNWQTSLALGDGVRQVEVHPKSAAYREGIRTGNFVRPIKVNGAAGIPIEEFDTLVLPVGTTLSIEYCRHDRGRANWLLADVVLTSAPEIPKVPKWKTAPQGLCGRRVQRSERAKFLNEMRRKSDVTAAMFRCLNLALYKYDNQENNGFWPSYETWARDLGCERRAAITIISRLRWIGVVRLVSGPTKYRRSNLYQVTWPSHVAPAPPNAAWV